MIPRGRVAFGATALVSLWAASACGPGAPPAGQPAMVTLTAQTMGAVRQEFNGTSDRTRVVLLLSPT